MPDAEKGACPHCGAHTAKNAERETCTWCGWYENRGPVVRHDAERDARTTLDYLEGLSARSSDGRVRDAIALVRSAVWDDLDTRVTSPAVREHEDCGDVDCETCHPTAPIIVGELDPSIPTCVLPPGVGA